jgi:hypothetical protein
MHHSCCALIFSPSSSNFHRLSPQNPQVIQPMPVLHNLLRVSPMQTGTKAHSRVTQTMQKLTLHCLLLTPGTIAAV